MHRSRTLYRPVHRRQIMTHPSVLRWSVRIQQHIPMHIGFLPSPSAVIIRAFVHVLVLGPSHHRNLLPGHIRADILPFPYCWLGLYVGHVHIGRVLRDRKWFVEDVQTRLRMVHMVHDDYVGNVGRIAGLLAEGNCGQGI